MRNILRNKHTPFFLFAFAIMIALTLPSLIQDGMFMDAVLYTSVSHNLSQGIGTCWFPQFSPRNLAIDGVNGFLEQPPLGYWIQSLFFRLFGSSMYVERFYTFLMMCISGGFIVALWRSIYKSNAEIKGMGWLPLILWITIPVCFWSFSNNMLENTMGVFILGAVLFAYKSCCGKTAFLNSVIAGLFVFLASFTKGIPGFFPIVVPALWWLVTRKSTFGSALKQTAVILLVPALVYCALFIFPESRESLSQYLFKRAFQRIGEAPNVGSHFYILFRLFSELLPAMFFVNVVFIIGGIRNIRAFVSEHLRLSLFFICIGFCGSLPLMLTRVQKGFYFVPSLPFFAIGFAIITAPIICQWISKIRQAGRLHKIIIAAGFVLLLSSVFFSLMQIGKTRRNKEMLHDVYVIGKVVPSHTTVSVPDFETWNQWDLQSYFMRYFNISLDDKSLNSFMIVDRQLQREVIPGYVMVGTQTNRYNLYRKI